MKDQQENEAQKEKEPSGCSKPVVVPLGCLIVMIGLIVTLFLGMVGVFYPAFAGDLTNGGTSGNISTASSSTPTVQPTLAPTKNPTLTPKPTPTHALKWTTIASFKGNGSKKTTVFTVPNNWKLVWSCVPSSFDGSYNLSVDVKGSDGSDVDLGAVNTICAAGNTGDSTQEYQGGAVYLDVQSEAVWSIQVQVLK